MKQMISQSAVKSLISIESLAVLTSIHHLNELGISFLPPAILVVVLPIVFMFWYSRRRSRAAGWTYFTFISLVIVGFGLYDGLWNHTIKMIVFFIRGAKHANMITLPFPPVGTVFHEVTGLLVFAATVFAIYFGYRFATTIRKSDVYH